MAEFKAMWGIPAAHRMQGGCSLLLSFHLATWLPPLTHCSAAGQQAGEDDGWLVAICFDAAQQRSEAVVLNAQDLAAGPLAVLPLRNILPHGLHGCWHDTYLGPS